MEVDFYGASSIWVLPRELHLFEILINLIALCDIKENFGYHQSYWFWEINVLEDLSHVQGKKDMTREGTPHFNWITCFSH